MVQNKDNGGKPNKKNLLKGQSEISKHFFDLDIKWVEENFSTR